jgi:hypothetical protein
MQRAAPAGTIAAAFVALVLQVSAAAPDKWIEIRSARFTITSNAQESAARDVVQRLDEFVDVVSSLVQTAAPADHPLTVIAFKDDRSFGPFRPRQNGRTLNLSGYFERADDENLIALSLQIPVDEQPYRVMFHEYTHALTSQAAGIWPLWLYEGLAEFYSTFDVYGTRLVIGRPIRQHVRLLEQESLLPLASLFAIDRASPMYNEDRQSIF